jgi:hypothetical protein
MRRAIVVLAAALLLAACRSSPPPSAAPAPPAFRVPAPGKVTVLSIAFPGADADPARSRLAWAAGPVAVGPDGAVLIADTDSDDGRVVVVAREGARSRLGGAAWPTLGYAGLAGRRRHRVRQPGGPGGGVRPLRLQQPSSLTALGRDGVAFVDHPGGVGTGTARVWAYQAGELRLLSWFDHGAPRLGVSSRRPPQRPSSPMSC